MVHPLQQVTYEWRSLNTFDIAHHNKTDYFFVRSSLKEPGLKFSLHQLKLWCKFLQLSSKPMKNGFYNGKTDAALTIV